MAEQAPLHFSDNWITIKNEHMGLQVDFPYAPLEMSFDVPFQNHPPQGQIRLYSVPTPKGLLVLATYSSLTLHSNWLNKEQFHQFFEKIFVPHFFFHPAIFQEQQVFDFHSTGIDEQHSASFKFSFQDHEMTKRLEGLAQIKQHRLYLSFYLASEKEFDQEIFDRFLNSIQF